MKALNFKKTGMLMALVAIILVFQLLTQGVLLTPQNVTNLILQNSYIIILAVGMMFCVIGGGHIDLSVGSVVAFVGAVTAICMTVFSLSPWIAVPIGLVAGLLIGCWNGFWISYIGIPSFIVTLGGMLIFRGLTIAALGGTTISPLPAAFNQISSGFVPNIMENGFNVTSLLFGVLFTVAYVVLAVLGRKKAKKPMDIQFWIMTAIVGAVTILFFTWLGLYKGMPILLLIVLCIVGLYTFLAGKTAPGVHLYAMGGNRKATELSGVNVKKILFLVFVNMGILASVAGVVLTARLQAATTTAGQNFELDAIAACFIGGASTTGGKGTIVGAVIGALVMGVLNNGLSIMGVGSDITLAVKGLVLLVAVAVDLISKRKAVLA